VAIKNLGPEASASLDKNKTNIGFQKIKTLSRNMPLRISLAPGGRYRNKLNESMTTIKNYRV